MGEREVEVEGERGREREGMSPSFFQWSLTGMRSDTLILVAHYYYCYCQFYIQPMGAEGRGLREKSGWRQPLIGFYISQRGYIRARLSLLCLQSHYRVLRPGRL